MLLIPTLLSAGRALLGFIAPFTPLIKVFGLLGAAINPVTLLITALSAAFLLLFDDYKTWSEGGKSLFDWGALSAGIKECKLFVDALSDSFANMSRAFSDMVMNMIASVTGENADDISGFIGESVYRLTHGGKTFDEVEGVTQLPVFSKSSSSNSSSTPADAAVKAAQFATKHAQPKSTSDCARFVNDALRAQGIKVLGHGKDVADNLLKTGKFQEVAYSENYAPQIGDVMSIPPIPGHPYGHVAIWNGEYWVSDYVQQNKRGNTAAPADAYFTAIKSGKIKPVIARMQSTSGSSEVVRKGMMAAAAVPVQNKATPKATGEGVYRNKNFTKEKAESIARVAKNIGVDPNDLAAVISFETGGTFNPNIRNPKSSATGLIQFMAGSGGKKGLYYGMTRDQFGGLSFDEQMKYVERYFKERGFDGKRKRDVADTYTAVTGYGYREGSKAYELNKVWDSNKDGYIAKGEMVRNAKFRAHQRQYYANIANNAQKALDMVSQNQQMQTSSNSIKNDNSKQVNVNIQKFEVKTSSSTVSGNAVAAMKELNNYTFNQLGTSMT
ncbi:MAG: hypothetical protein J6568_00385 [Snodgrassella sp.]|nr:hypothetical protein [Snodgrassella sp.]